MQVGTQSADISHALKTGLFGHTPVTVARFTAAKSGVTYLCTHTQRNEHASTCTYTHRHVHIHTGPRPRNMGR